MSESEFRLAEMLQIKTLALILSMLRLTVLLLSLSGLIHLELFNMSLAMCLHQARLIQQLNSHLSALASWNGTAVLQPRKGEAEAGKKKKSNNPEITPENLTSEK